MKSACYGLKRALVALHDAIALLVVCALLACAPVAPAYAYVDPSVMTYTIQALAGVAVALSAVAGVAFRRSRKALLKALNIDEDARKEHEPDVHRVKDGVVVLQAGEQTADADATDEAAVPSAKRGAPAAPSMKWWQRLVVAAIVSVFAVATVGLVAPYELIAGNSSSLLFSLVSVWRPIALAAALAALVLALVLSVLRGRAFSVAVTVVFCFGLCCYVQAMFMNAGLPAGDGHQVDWGEFWVMTVVSAIVWIALFAVPLVLQHRFGKVVVLGATAVSVMLVIVQGVGVASLFANQDGLSGEVVADNYVTTEEGMFTVSPDSNVIVFVLDTYDTVDLMEALEQDPDMLAELTGFTWFQDSVGAMDPTRYGAVFLSTGAYPQPDEDLTTFVAERYERSHYLGDIYDAGYSIGFYTDTVGDYLMPEQERREMIYDKTININLPGSEGLALDEGATVLEMLKCSLYRDLPWIVKPAFWFTTDEVNQAMALERGDGASTPYAMDDAYWYEKLKDHGLSIDDSSEYVGAYRFIHMLGTHVPYELGAEGQDVGMWNSDRVTQARGSMHIVAEYLRQLKELGVYDNSTIIVTADHGEWFDKDYRDDWDIPTSPIMLVKPAHAPNEPVVTSAAQITAYDLLPTVIKAVGGPSNDYGPTVFEQPESGRDRRYLHTITYQNDDLEIIEYKIDGNVLDEGNWTKTGTTWDPTNTPR